MVTVLQSTLTLKIYVFSPCVFMIIGINSSYLPLKYLVFAVEMQHVFCNTGTKFLFSIKVHLIIQRNVSISTVQKKCKFPRHIVKTFVDIQTVVVYVHLKLDKIHDTDVFFNCDFFVMQTVFLFCFVLYLEFFLQFVTSNYLRRPYSWF